MKSVDNLIQNIRKLIPFNISNEDLKSIAIDISRLSDKKITKKINEYKITNNLKINRVQKTFLRSYMINKNIVWNLDLPVIDRNDFFSDEEIIESLEILLLGIKKNPRKLIGTIESRLNKEFNKKNNYIKYNNFLASQNSSKYQHIIIEVNNIEYLNSSLKLYINNVYNNLTNYHYLAIVFNDVPWEKVSKIAVFCENFKQESKLNIYNKTKKSKIDEFNLFLKNNNNFNYDLEVGKLIENFYDTISYGFQFIDLYISRDSTRKILILQKIELDENKIPCPDCYETNVRGNSYSKLLFKSFECQNPNCPSRSKIGRGKRFDLFNIKRNIKLIENSINNQVNIQFAKKYRKDIFDSDDYLLMLLKFYSWENENVLYTSNFNDCVPDILINSNRNLFFNKINTFESTNEVLTPIEDLLTKFKNKININVSKSVDSYNAENYSIYNGDSSSLEIDCKLPIIAAITSPPYYNAREYSQWSNLLFYLVDMMVNSSNVYKNLNEKSYYFYNIGDIVGQDNVYINSNMSKRRLMLGFYSVMIFEIVGFRLIDNIIWGKGEVQSKRNSSENLFPGYIKPINCYEHILVFGKNVNSLYIKEKYVEINPVKKINSKGINTYGHTAPYPEELVYKILEIIKNAEIDSGYILDPFLGSGTTVISCLNKNFKSLGVELDPIYYKLAVKRIEENLKINRLPLE